MSRSIVVWALIALALPNAPSFAQEFPGLSTGYVPWGARCYERRPCEDAARDIMRMSGYTYGLKVNPPFVSGVNGAYHLQIVCVREARMTFFAVAGPESRQTMNIVNSFMATWEQGTSHCR